MNLQDQFKKETNKDYKSDKSHNYPYLCGTGMYNDKYVEWLEHKLNNDDDDNDDSRWYPVPTEYETPEAELLFLTKDNKVIDCQGNEAKLTPLKIDSCESLSAPFYCHPEQASGIRCSTQCLGCDGTERDENK